MRWLSAHNLCAFQCIFEKPGHCTFAIFSNKYSIRKMEKGGRLEAEKKKKMIMMNKNDKKKNNNKEVAVEEVKGD